MNPALDADMRAARNDFDRVRQGDESFPRRDWREKFLQLCGPGVLAGIRFRDWRKLLRERGRSIELSRGLRAFTITSQSLKNSFWARVEKRFESQIREVRLQPPIFILGHWRSGTTHVHNLLAQDERFAFPNSYQVSFPHNFLSTEKLDARWLSYFIPRRRPMDNMEMTLALPQEDEFALCALTLKSPCMALVFPRQQTEFEKYLTLESLPPEELAEWRDAFTWFLKKVQLRLGDRPLLLKSPPHTARIRLLRQWFPEARFIHIHRDPYRVIQSTIHTLRCIYPWHGLHRPAAEKTEEFALRQYSAVYRAFFRDKPLVPAEQFCEISYEALEKDPVEQMKQLYRALALPDFAGVQPALKRYLESIEGYQKNRLADLDEALKRRVRQECAMCFEAWGYPG